MKILLIEDDETLRNCFETYLERRGHTVHLYNRSEGAIEYALQMRPDLVLTDHNLEPDGLRGVQIAYFLIKHGQPAVLMSGDPTVAASAKASGVPFVEKTDIKEVILTIEEAHSHGK